MKSHARIFHYSSARCALFGPPTIIAGVLADRSDRVWTIRITQWIGCAQACLLAILVVTDAMTIEILFALVLMLGIASGVARPSRLALIPTLVDRESLASALAINSVVFNLARFIGPALAGIVIADFGIAAAFAANAVSYIGTSAPFSGNVS